MTIKHLGGIFGRNPTFNDVTIDGGIYIGGDTSSNLLDDYEEGLHTATLTPTTSGSITLNASGDTLSYIKIGSFVSVTGKLNVASVSSPVGAINISLPFTSASLTDEADYWVGSVIVTASTINVQDFTIAMFANSSNAVIYDARTQYISSVSANTFSGDETVRFTLNYRAA